MKSSKKFIRSFQGIAVALGFGMLLVVGGFVYAQKIIELPDFSFGHGESEEKITEFKEVESTPESIRESEHEALEARLVDPIIDAFIEEDLRFFKTAEARGSDVLSELEQSYHTRTTQVIHLRKQFVKQIVTPLLDITPEQRENKTTVISHQIRRTPKRDGGFSISMTSGFSFREQISIELNDLVSMVLPVTPFSGNQTQSFVPAGTTVYEIPDFEFVAQPLSYAVITCTCTNIKYAPPQQKGTSNYIYTQLTGDCEHDFRDNYSEADWEIVSANIDTWIWEISLVKTGDGDGLVGNNQASLSMLNSDPPNPASLFDYDSHLPCESGTWNTIVNVGLKLIVRNKHDHQLYQSYEELRDVFNFGDETIYCQ